MGEREVEQSTNSDKNGKPHCSLPAAASFPPPPPLPPPFPMFFPTTATNARIGWQVGAIVTQRQQNVTKLVSAMSSHCSSAVCSSVRPGRVPDSSWKNAITNQTTDKLVQRAISVLASNTRDVGPHAVRPPTDRRTRFYCKNPSSSDNLRREHETILALQSSRPTMRFCVCQRARLRQTQQQSSQWKAAQVFCVHDYDCQNVP